MNESKYKILVVDDEEDIVEFVSYNLKKEGFSVDIARNGRDAVNTAISFQPHLILLDIMMPEMDGIETCEEIRSIPSLTETLVAFLYCPLGRFYPDCRFYGRCRRFHHQARQTKGAHQQDQSIA